MVSYPMTDRVRFICEEAHRCAIKHFHTHVCVVHLVVALLEEGEELYLKCVRKEKLRMFLLDFIENFLVGENREEVTQSSLFLEVLENAQKIMVCYGDHCIGKDVLWLSVIEKASVAFRQVFDHVNLKFWAIQELVRGMRQASTKNLEGLALEGMEHCIVDLTQKARLGQLDTVFAKEKEIFRIIQILSCRDKKIPLLIGKYGVGKTSIVQGLACQIVKKNVPEYFFNKEIFAFNLYNIVAESHLKKKFIEQFRIFLSFLKKKKSTAIALLENIHILFQMENKDAPKEVLYLLKIFILDGETCCIGTTIFENYRQYFKDSFLLSSLLPVYVEEATEEESIEILKTVKIKYEEHHDVKISEAAIIACVQMAQRYISVGYLPLKAIQLMDEASSVRRETKERTEKNILQGLSYKNRDQRQWICAIFKLENSIEQEKINLKHWIVQGRLKEAAEIQHGRLPALMQKLHELQFLQMSNAVWITQQHIGQEVSRFMGIAVNKVLEDERHKLCHMEERLKTDVIGQDSVIQGISQCIRRRLMGLSQENRPLGAFVFLGPSGVGKTALCKSLAKVLVDHSSSMLSLDMYEYREKQSMSRLTGVFQRFIPRDSYGILVLEDIEKAHGDILHWLLKIFEKGYFKDVRGRNINFKQILIILTSKEGSSVQERKGMDFLDDILVFRSLTKEHLSQILDLYLQGFEKRLEKKYGMTLYLGHEARDLLLKEGYSETFGARPLRRLVQKYIEDPLSLKLMDHEGIVHVNVLDHEDQIRLYYVVKSPEMF